MTCLHGWRSYVDGEKTTREGWLSLLPRMKTFSYFSFFWAHPKGAVKWLFGVVVRWSRSPVHTGMFSISPLLLTCCVIMTGSSVDAAGHVFYQLVCAFVVEWWMSVTGPLGKEEKKLWSYFKHWSQYQNTSRFSLASHHQASNTHLNEVNGRLLHKDHLHNSAVRPSSSGQVSLLCVLKIPSVLLPVQSG